MHSFGVYAGEVRQGDKVTIIVPGTVANRGIIPGPLCELAVDKIRGATKEKIEEELERLR